MNTSLPATPSTTTARGWLMVAVLLAAATLAGLLLDRFVSLTSLAMLYVLTVVVVACRLGWIDATPVAWLTSSACRATA